MRPALSGFQQGVGDVTPRQARLSFHTIVRIASVLSLLSLIAAIPGQRTLGPAAQPRGERFPGHIPQAAEDSRATESQPVRISVLSLFHPASLHIEAAGSSLLLRIDGLTQQRLLQPGTRLEVTTLKSDESSNDNRNHRLQLTIMEEASSTSSSLSEGTRLEVLDPSGKQTAFRLAVPGKLERQYTGALEITNKDGVLQAVMTMPLELAVAAIVQAESPAHAAMEALKAQAVASRSFLVARQTAHLGFDFCDTTHCQYVGPPAAKDSLAFLAAKATHGIVLSYRDPARAGEFTLPAMYARSCGGHTRTLKEIGTPTLGYPYYRVSCLYCSRHPEAWQRSVPVDAADEPNTEKQRLAFNRIHGWAALPSLPTIVNSTSAIKAPLGIAGQGMGHGLGLCQLGAADMAKRGAGYEEILAHYYPNTRLATIPDR